MSAPDVPDAAEHFAASPLLPRDAAGLVFAEPWQAQTFALAVQLSAAGHFTWTEWTTALGAQLQAAVDRGVPDDGSRYFEHWLAALEQLDVHFINSLPVKQRPACTVWADKRPAQIV